MKRLFAIFFMACTAGLLAGCPSMTPAPNPAVQNLDDRQIANDINFRLREDSWTKVMTFGVAVENGIATIQGSVPDEVTRARVLGIVRSTPGVTEVVDKIYRR